MLRRRPTAPGCAAVPTRAGSSSRPTSGRAPTAEILERIAGEPPVVLSDEPGSSADRRCAVGSAGSSRFGCLSRGVSTSPARGGRVRDERLTPLFAQAVGAEYDEAAASANSSQRARAHGAHFQLERGADHALDAAREEGGSYCRRRAARGGEPGGQRRRQRSCLLARGAGVRGELRPRPVRRGRVRLRRFTGSEDELDPRQGLLSRRSCAARGTARPASRGAPSTGRPSAPPRCRTLPSSDGCSTSSLLSQASGERTPSHAELRRLCGGRSAQATIAQRRRGSTSWRGDY